MQTVNAFVPGCGGMGAQDGISTRAGSTPTPVRDSLSIPFNPLLRAMFKLRDKRIQHLFASGMILFLQILFFQPTNETQ